jgi:kynurenine formamidase
MKQTQTMSNTETNDEPRNDMRRLFDLVSNWGRWGPGDQAGTLNLLKWGGVAAFRESISDGPQLGLSRVVSPTHTQANRSPLLHHMLSSGADAKDGEHGMSDWFGIAPHGFGVTHVDALSHMAWDGKLYNGVPAASVTTMRGGKHGSVEALQDGVVGRGVLLDLPKAQGLEWLELGTAVRPEQLEACESELGVTVREGDILLVRTGRDARERIHGPMNYWVDGIAGLHWSCAEWLHSRGVSMLVTDGGGEVIPSGIDDVKFPLHVLCLVSMGMCLIDNAYLEDLAAACMESGKFTFGFMMSAIPLQNSTGAPVNPIVLT